jgi:hypothetical protein
MGEVRRIFRKSAPAAVFKSAFTATGITSVPPLVSSITYPVIAIQSHRLSKRFTRVRQTHP